MSDNKKLHPLDECVSDNIKSMKFSSPEDVEKALKEATKKCSEKHAPSKQEVDFHE